jgi:hypothetical protein
MATLRLPSGTEQATGRIRSIYAIKFVREARAELDAACPAYGEEFCGSLWAWLREIAQAAKDRHTPAGSIDVESIAEAIGGEPTTLLLKLGAKLWEWLRRKKDKRRLFVAVRGFFVLGQFWETVQVKYKIDHDAEQIIIRMFQGLPGQGE